MEPQERAPSAGAPCLQPQDLQYPGGLERGKGEDRRPCGDPGGQLKKRDPGGLLRLSLSDVPAFWRAGKMLLRRAYCGIRIPRDPVGRWDPAFMPQL